MNTRINKNNKQKIGIDKNVRRQHDEVIIYNSKY